MRIYAVGDHLQTPAIRSAAAEAGAEIRFVASRQAAGLVVTGDYDVLLADCDHGDKEPLSNPGLCAHARFRVPLCPANAAAGIVNVSAEDVTNLNAWFAYGGPGNLRSAFARLGQLVRGVKAPLPPPVPVPLDAIFLPDGRLLPDLAAWEETDENRFPRRVGMLSYRSRWSDGDLALERAIIDGLNRRSIGVVAAFTDGSPDPALGNLTFQQAVDRFFCRDGKPAVGLLVNFQFFGAKGGDGEDMFHKAAECFRRLDVPVIRPVGLSRKSEEFYRGTQRPYAGDLPTNFIVPEYQGMIEPIHVSCADAGNHRVPDPERVERLCARIAAWLRLREKPNREKRVAIMLHNAPCSGVEATVGMAADLDAFAGAAALLHRLSDEGYAVEDLPADGEELKKRILERKAYSDFRWTSAEDIDASGGALVRMEPSEYAGYYDRLLTPGAKKDMEAHWGPPPGEAMVSGGRILITGVPFGNVVVMVQPKRGCYGAKCTGEVCRILQDPACPPSHQYLASYWYLQHNWGADAVIHLGTHGSLEYLPGKQSGLSRDCFPDIALGDLPDLYPYNAAVAAQALIARRRAYAVTLSYLPAPDKGLDPAKRQLGLRIDQYFAAQEQGSAQLADIRRAVEEAVGASPAGRAVLTREPDFDEALRQLRELLARTEESRRGGSRRAFGEVPDRDWVRDYITQVWLADPAIAALWQGFPDPLERADRMAAFIDTALDAPERLSDPGLASLAEDARAIAAGLSAAAGETDALLRALSGRYIPPSPCGDGSWNGREILPTGRNLHGAEQDRIPTEFAYRRGAEAAEALLEKYRAETGALPEKVALNMTSLDVARSGGEQLGQFMALMGVKPVWNASGRVEALACIPLQALGRPRVDVTARISSVMRDAWPQLLALMDRAVQLAASRPEPAAMNHVRANSEAIAAQGEEGTGRIFGGQPGTYTSAVGLALKASAWKNETDLAKYFIDSSSYLYGENKDGLRAPGAFAANVRQVDLTADVTASRRTDGGASSYSARVQGGYKLAAKALGSRRKLRQYMGETAADGSLKVVPMADHVTRAIRDTLLNDVWLEQVRAEGYAGGAELMSRIQNLFDTQCVLENLTPELLDDVARRILLDADLSRWFRENNPHALEESGRRFLELHERGKWKGDPDILRRLQRAYLRAEGELEDGAAGLGEIQGGNVDIVNAAQVERWSARLKETEELLQGE